MPPTRVGNTQSLACLCVVRWPRSGRTAFVITVAPVHCKYGRFLQIFCFYSLVNYTLIWDAVCLSSSILNHPLVQFENEILLRMFNRQNICTCAKCTRLPKKVRCKNFYKNICSFSNNKYVITACGSENALGETVQSAHGQSRFVVFPGLKCFSKKGEIAKSA